MIDTKGILLVATLTSFQADGEKCFRLAFSPRGDQLACCLSNPQAESGTVVIYSWPKAVQLASCSLPEHPLTASFLSDGNRLVVGCHNGLLALIDCKSGQMIAKLRMPGPVFHTGSSRLADEVAFGLGVSGEEPDEGIVSIKGTTLHKKKGLKQVHDGRVFCVSFLGKSNKVASGGSDRKVFVWDSENGSATHLFSLDNGISALAVSANDHYLVVGSYSKPNAASCILWDLAKSQQMSKHEGLKDKVTSVGFSSDCELFALAVGDKVLLGKTRTPKDPFKVIDARQEVLDITFAPTEAKMLISDVSGEVGIWSVATLNKIKQLR